jgi:RimJ/RimL family protein N-acetyltransferase
MHPHLTNIIAQERVAEMRAAAERSRQTTADQLQLADGRRLKIRPIERQDRDRLTRLFMQLTPESRYRRYLTAKPALSERELDYLLNVDHLHHEALAAVDETTDSFVAAARYVQLPNQPNVADVAFEVADHLHRQGIGTALTTRTLERARANGITRVTALTLRENAPARALLQRLRFRPLSHCGHEIELGLELTPDLATSGERAELSDLNGEQHRTERGWLADVAAVTTSPRAGALMEKEKHEPSELGGPDSRAAHQRRDAHRAGGMDCP